MSKRKQTGESPGSRRIERPTLKTIAGITELGVTTVSRALKDAPDISAQTKQLVRTVAEEIGYTPNRAGVGLRTGKTNVITLALSLDEEIMGVTSHLVRGIADTLSNSPYHLTITPYSHDKSPLDTIRYIVETRSADGIILSRTEPDDPRINYLHTRNIPFTTHGRTQSSIEHPYHDFDNERFVQEAVDRLVTKSRRRIALLTPPPSLNFYQHVMCGYDKAVKAHQLDPYKPLAVNIDFSLDEIEAFSQQVFSRRDRPDGIVSLSGGSTIALCCGLEKAGLTLGVEVDIVSKQSVNILPRFRDKIDTVFEDIALAGRELGQQVLASIQGVKPRLLQSVVYTHTD